VAEVGRTPSGWTDGGAVERDDSRPASQWQTVGKSVRTVRFIDDAASTTPIDGLALSAAFDSKAIRTYCTQCV